jgi:hypothetical protein
MINFSGRMRPTCFLDRKGRSGRKPEITAAYEELAVVVAEKAELETAAAETGVILETRRAVVIDDTLVNEGLKEE